LCSSLHPQAPRYDPIMALPRFKSPGKVVRLVPQTRAPAPSLDDAATLAAVRAGDRSAAHALHQRVRPIALRTVSRLLGSCDPDRDDVVQTSLIELVRSLGRFRGECSLDTWVARVAAHTVFKEIRRRRMERRMIARAIGDDEEMHGGDLDKDVGDRSLAARLRDHLGAMSWDRAFTLVLHDVCGHDLREIAEITEASVAAAQSRLVRGRRELHERIGRDPELRDLLEQSDG